MEPNKGLKPKNKFSILRITIALGIIFVAVVLIISGYLLYNKIFGETDYCQYLRTKENISNDYNCRVGNEYLDTKTGKWDVYVTFDRPSSKFIDGTTYIIEKNTKEILKRYTAI